MWNPSAAGNKMSLRKSMGMEMGKWNYLQTTSNRRDSNEDFILTDTGFQLEGSTDLLCVRQSIWDTSFLVSHLTDNALYFT